MTKRSPAEAEVLKFTKMHGEWTAVGIVSVQAARRLVAEGLIATVKDEADRDGIGSITVRTSTAEDLATRTYTAGERVQADRTGRRYWFTVTENYPKTIVGVHTPGAMPVTIKKTDIERVESKA